MIAFTFNEFYNLITVIEPNLHYKIK